MSEKANSKFGKRRPVTEQPGPPAKRSRHVALLLMGAMAVGGGAYLLMPSESCGPNRPEMTSDPQAKPECPPRASSSGGGASGGGSSSGSRFFGDDSSSGRSASATSSDVGSDGVTRGGFGSFGRGFGGHGSGGE